jgi:hypothetical protein
MKLDFYELVGGDPSSRCETTEVCPLAGIFGTMFRLVGRVLRIIKACLPASRQPAIEVGTALFLSAWISNKYV